jgi:hypothetical protein
MSGPLVFQLYLGLKNAPKVEQGIKKVVILWSGLMAPLSL